MKTKLPATRAPRIHPATLQKLSSLPPPAAPLKGRGFRRESFHWTFRRGSLASMLWDAIPDAHKTEIAVRRPKGYFGNSRAISPEAWKAAGGVIASIETAEKEETRRLFAIYTRQPTYPVNRPSGSGRTYGGTIALNPDALAASRLSAGERKEFAALMAGASHPVTGRALDLKHASGLTWGQIES